MAHTTCAIKQLKKKNHINVSSKINVLIYNNQCSINSGQMEIPECHTSVEFFNLEKTGEFSKLA